MKYSISKLFKKKKSEFLTAEELLGQVIQSSDLQNILSFCPDKRELYEAAALAVGSETSELLAQIAQKSEFSYAARVLPMEIDLLPEGVSLEHLKRIGAIGVTSDGVLQGMIAIDPALVKKLFPAIERNEIMLSSWGDIRNAIELSEKNYAEKLRQRKDNDPAQKNLVKQVYEYMHSEMLKYGSEKIVLEFSKEAISYSLPTNDEKEARGAVHISFARGMLYFLKKDRSLLPSGLIVKELVSEEKYELIRSEAQSHVEVAKEEAIEVEVTEAVAQHEVMPSNVLVLPERRPIKNEEESSESELKEIEEKIVFDGEILIVDDNKVFRDVLSKFLERKGLSVKSVDRADQALHDLTDSAEKRPALVICDMHIPGMNGLSFVSKLRGIQDLELLPVIMLSSDDTVETRLQCLGAGADLYLQKSEDPRILCAHIVRFFARMKKYEAA